jgi:chromosome segregation ATPase
LGFKDWISNLLEELIRDNERLRGEISAADEEKKILLDDLGEEREGTKALKERENHWNTKSDLRESLTTISQERLDGEEAAEAKQAELKAADARKWRLAIKETALKNKDLQLDIKILSGEKEQLQREVKHLQNKLNKAESQDLATGLRQERRSKNGYNS